MELTFPDHPPLPDMHNWTGRFRPFYPGFLQPQAKVPVSVSRIRIEITRRKSVVLVETRWSKQDNGSALSHMLMFASGN